MSTADHIAHVLDDDGVTEAPFVRVGADLINSEEITLRPGAVLDLGNGWTLRYPAEPPQFTVPGLDVEL